MVFEQIGDSMDEKGGRRQESKASPADRSNLLGQGIRLELFTIAWNVLEALIALAAGWLAGSIALVGFGLDSAIETIAAIAVYWRLRAEMSGAGEQGTQRLERRALRVVGITLFLLALYIIYEAGSTLWFRESPETSTVGIALAALSLTVMPILAWSKHRVGKALGSAALMADSKETLICSYLSLALLVGLGLNALFGWWWADPVAALAMLPLVIYEGREALEEASETREEE